MSPIMTIASDKIHLSEEMRDFSEEEKIHGKTVKGASMFERFWRSNPALLNEFSTAITDTIELFENVYAGGDAVTGAATVILAMGAGKTAAESIDEYLSNK